MEKPRLEPIVFKKVNTLLVGIRQLMRENKTDEADKEVRKINLWLGEYDFRVVFDNKYMVSIEPTGTHKYAESGTIICACGAIKEKEYSKCYDCFIESKNGNSKQTAHRQNNVSG